MYALPALTLTAAEVVRAQFAPEAAPEPGRRMHRMRAALADALASASRAVAPPRPRPAPTLAS